MSISVILSKIRIQSSYMKTKIKAKPEEIRKQLDKIEHLDCRNDHPTKQHQSI